MLNTLHGGCVQHVKIHRTTSNFVDKEVGQRPCVRTSFRTLRGYLSGLAVVGHRSTLGRKNNDRNRGTRLHGRICRIPTARTKREQHRWSARLDSSRELKQTRRDPTRRASCTSSAPSTGHATRNPLHEGYRKHGGRFSVKLQSYKETASAARRAVTATAVAHHRRGRTRRNRRYRTPHRTRRTRAARRARSLGLPGYHPRRRRCRSCGCPNVHTN